MTFRRDETPAQLPIEQYDRLVKLLAIHYSYPLPYPLAGGYFEEIFSSAVGAVREERKLLFDSLRNATGWSLKTLQWPRLEPDGAVEVVIQRCDILKDTSLSMGSEVPQLGEAILRHFAAFAVASAELQGVTDQRTGFLIRDTPERNFLFFQQRYRLYEPAEVEWRWANEAQRSLMGYAEGHLVLRWYRSGTQLFGVYRIPPDPHQFSIDWRRAGLEETIGFFESQGITRLEE